MNHETTCSQGPANRSAAEAHHSKLAQQLIDALRVRCSSWLHAPLERGLAHFDARLLALANDAGNHFDQHNYLETRQRLNRMRADFDRRFIASIDRCFQNLGKQADELQPVARLSLDLLDTTTHDRDAALDQLVTRCTARGAMQMINLGYRFGVLLGTPPLDSAQLPVGPQAMACAFRDACASLDMPTAHELLLLQSLESSLIDQLTSLYELTDGHLRDAGILPGLRPYALPRPTRRSAARGPDAPAARAAARTESPARPAAPATHTTPMRAAGGTAHAPRHVPASDAQLQAALSSLQEHLLEADEQARFELNRAQRLQEELSLLVNIGRAANAPIVGLTRTQTSMVELITRLFGEIAQKLPRNADTHALLYGLQIPVLRVALQDPTFLRDHEHPARRVLNKVADVARDWLDEASGTPEHDMRIELERLIDEACRSTPDTTVFAALLDDIDQCLARWQLERQRAEAQQVDAMRGLERLEQARLRTRELLVVQNAESGHGAREAGPLHHAWSDVLALTMLRHGEDSAIFGDRLGVSDQLSGLQPIRDLRALQRELDTGLRQVGMPGDERTRMIEQWLHAGRDAHAGKDLGEETSPAPAAAVDANAGETDTSTGLTGNPSPDVLRLHRYLRRLPAGTWFEFIGPNGMPPIRRRLVWYSPLTGHSVFVTRNGQRAQELGELKLAMAIASGHIREIAAGRENVIDQALHLAVHHADALQDPQSHGAAS